MIVGEPQLTGTATLTVNVDDVNEHGPEFAEDYDIWIPKTPRVGAVVARIKIVDRDAPQNGPPFEIKDNVCSNRNDPPACRDFEFEVTGSKC